MLVGMLGYGLPPTGSSLHFPLNLPLNSTWNQGTCQGGQRQSEQGNSHQPQDDTLSPDTHHHNQIGELSVRLGHTDFLQYHCLIPALLQ